MEYKACLHGVKRFMHISGISISILNKGLSITLHLTLKVPIHECINTWIRYIFLLCSILYLEAFTLCCLMVTLSRINLCPSFACIKDTVVNTGGKKKMQNSLFTPNYRAGQLPNDSCPSGHVLFCTFCQSVDWKCLDTCTKTPITDKSPCEKTQEKTPFKVNSRNSINEHGEKQKGLVLTFHLIDVRLFSSDC